MAFDITKLIVYRSPMIDLARLMIHPGPDT